LWNAFNAFYRIQISSKQVAQLSQKEHAAGWVSYGQKWKTVTGRQYFTHTIGCVQPL